LLLLASVAFTLTNMFQIHSVGTIKAVNVGVYDSFSCANIINEIDWGVLEPASATNRTVYIRNEANVPVVLRLETGNWAPANASSFMNLTWNYDQRPLEVDETVKVTFTLEVSPEISGIDNFSFDILVIGEG